MPRFITTLPLIAALMLGTTAFAQDETAAETEAAGAETETTVEAEATIDDTTTDSTPDLDMGEEVNQDPYYIKETYGDWQLKCFRNEGDEDPCQMYQLLKEDAGNPVAEFSIFRLAEGGQAEAGATIVVPLGTLLTKELRVSVDGGKAKTFSYSFCNLAGCFARIGLTSDDISSFRKGVSANLVIVPAQAPDQTVVIKASLKGFTAAYENVSTIGN